MKNTTQPAHKLLKPDLDKLTLNNTTTALNIQRSPTYIHWENCVLLHMQTKKKNSLSAGSRFDMLLPSDIAQSVVAAELQS